MGISIIPVGGYGEVGRNCTAVKVDDEIFIFDLGLHLDNFVRLSEDDDLKFNLTKKLLTKENAIPDVSVIDKTKVKAVLVSHAHLDHVGAVPYLANYFSCDVFGTPFSAELVRVLCLEKRVELKNKIVDFPFGEIFPLSDTVSAEFVEVTHSTVQAAVIVLHTPYGVVAYLNDFKLDNSPVIGNVSNLSRLKELKPRFLIVDTLYADLDAHTPSEVVAQSLLDSAVLSRDIYGKCIIASTFASHIARLEYLVFLAKKLGRIPMIIGRSMVKYLEVAKTVGVSFLLDDVEFVRYSSKAHSALKRITDFDNYFFIVTGGMGESRAVLSRIVSQDLIPLKRDDLIIFSNRVIPTSTIIAAREKLELDLKSRGFEVLTDLHVSGHGAGKDHSTILNILKPEFLIPVHGNNSQREAFREIALKEGYDSSKILMLKNAEAKSFN